MILIIDITHEDNCKRGEMELKGNKSVMLAEETFNAL
jgi:hypothetical protein